MCDHRSLNRSIDVAAVLEAVDIIVKMNSEAGMCAFLFLVGGAF